LSKLLTNALLFQAVEEDLGDKRKSRTIIKNFHNDQNGPMNYESAALTSELQAHRS
jgi:hypothetical protein